MDERSGQALLHDFIASRLQLHDTINAMMDFKLVRANMEKREVTFAFPVKDWQQNPMGVMHGGYCVRL